MFTNKYRKSLSPLITTILLIVVTFALIGIILGWGKSFTNQTKTTLDSFSETYTKDSTSMIKPIKFYSNNRLIINDLMSKKDLTITGYRILSDKNLPGLNTTVALSQPLVLSTGDSTSLIISRPPEKKFDLQLLTNDNKYITVYDIQNYPLEPVSTAINIPISGNNYSLDQNILFSQTTTGGDGSYSCEWKADSNIISTSCTDFNYSFSVGGTITISLKVTDLENNTKTVSENILVLAPITATITSPTNNSTYLFGNPINFLSNPTGGTGNYTCTWDSNIDGSLGSSCDFNISNLSVGTHLITLNVTDNLETISTTEVISVTYAPLSAAILSPTNGSYNINTSLSFSSNISGGDGTYSCLWKDNSVNLNSGCNFTHTYLPDWTTNSRNLPTVRKGITSAVVNGKIYVIGGYDGAFLKTVEEYDPVTDIWTTKAPMNYARAYLTSSVVNGKIYAIGGYNGTNNLNIVEEYDPATNSWTTKNQMPTARKGLTSAVINGKIYAIGGIGSSYLNTVEEYDPATNGWTTTIRNMSTAKGYLTSSVVNYKIYVIGGYNGSRLNTVDEYDPATDTWITKANMQIKRNTLASSVINNKIYAMGGYTDQGITNIVEEYDPVTNTWTTINSMNYARYGLTSSVVNKKIYAIGGYNYSYIGVIDEYDLGDLGSHNIVLNVNDSYGDITSTDVNITIN